MSHSIARNCFIAALVTFACAIMSRADTIVDTGAPPFLNNSLSGLVLGTANLPSGSLTQQAAAEFQLGNAMTLTSVESWIGQLDFGTVDLSINQDNGSVPGTALYSGAFTIGTFFTPGWYGLTDLDWTLDPGTYWVELSTPDQAFEGILPKLPPNPLALYADEITTNPSPHWLTFPGTTQAFGVQITGDPVPEGSSTALMLFCGVAFLAGLWKVRRGRFDALPMIRR
jgi:hypothetical protein